jgi:prepilin-type N-terminal cleavage/methylation domain-containing protein
MPILATGSRPARSDAGFSLVELLAVMAVLSLMVGAVVLSWPAARSPADLDSEAMAAQLSRFVDDGSALGEMRALGVSEDGVVAFRHDGLAWQEAAVLPWPETVRIRFERAGTRADLPEAATPDLLFEPFGAVPDFTLVLGGRGVEYRIGSDDWGRIVRRQES